MFMRRKMSLHISPPVLLLQFLASPEAEDGMVLAAAQGVLSSVSAPCLDMTIGRLPKSVPLTIGTSPRSVPLMFPALVSMPAGGSLQASLPARRRTRGRRHASTQTDTTELGELRVIHSSLDAVRRELTFVKHELTHLEQRLRYEMRLELEGRMRIHDERCVEKVSYMRKGYDLKVSQVRAAQRTRHDATDVQHGRQLKQLEAALAAHVQSSCGSETDDSRDETALQHTAQLEKLREENELLHEQLAEAHARGQESEAQAQEAKQKEVSRLEAAVVQREKTIEVLPQQLVQARRSNPGPSTEPTFAAHADAGSARAPAGGSAVRPQSAARQPTVA